MLWEQFIVAKRFHLSYLELYIAFYNIRIRNNFLNYLFQIITSSEEKNQAQ